MDEEFIRNRITELRLKKGISEYQLSLELGQNRGYIQAISSGRALPSMKQFLNICEYFEITPLQFFDDTENTPQLVRKALDGIRTLSDDDFAWPYCTAESRKMTAGAKWLLPFIFPGIAPIFSNRNIM